MVTPPENNGFSGEGLFDLIDDHQIDRRHTFPLPNRYSSDVARAFWIAMRKGNKVTAEGTLLVPECASKKLVVFAPGMPGGGSLEAVEKTFAPALLQEHYHLLILRHLGAWLHTKTAPLFIHCPERIALGRERDELTLGEQHPYTFKDVASEISAAVNALGPHFDDIRLIGHSSGALGCLWSLQHLQKNVQEKVHQMISLAGFTGGIENLRWPLSKNFGLKMYLKRCQKAINLVNPRENVAQIREMFHELYTSLIPEHTMILQVNTPSDEYIHPRSATRLQDHLGRGLCFLDETQYEKGYHDLKNLQAATLLRFLQMDHPHAKHSFRLRSKHQSCKRRKKRL